MSKKTPNTYDVICEALRLAPVHEYPPFLIAGKIKATLQEGLKVGNPSSRLAAHLETLAADVQGERCGAALAVRRLE